MADLLFVVFHILHKAPNEWFPFFDQDPFSVTRDLGLAEAFQYVKEYWVVLLLAWLILRHRKTELAGWALLFGYLLFDDMFSLHEKIGDIIGNLLGGADITLFANLQMDHIGEVIGDLGIGILFALILVPTYLRLKSDARSVFRTLTWMLAGLLFFGIGLDLLDRFVNSNIIQEMFKLAEDGGEMLAMSVICWYVYALTGQAPTKNEIPST
jgi:hypothetical protein